MVYNNIRPYGLQRFIPEKEKAPPGGRAGEKLPFWVCDRADRSSDSCTNKAKAEQSSEDGYVILIL